MITLDHTADYLCNAFYLSDDPITDLVDLCELKEVQAIALLASWVTIDPKERLAMGFSQAVMHTFIYKAIN